MQNHKKKRTIHLVFYSLLIFLFSLAFISAQFGFDNPTLPNIAKPVVNTYGDMFFHNDTAPLLIEISTAGIWNNITNLTRGIDNNVEFINPLNVSGFLILETGVYKIDYSASYQDGGNQEFQTSILVNGVEELNTEAHRSIGTGGDVGNAGGTGIINLAENDIVHIAISDMTAPPNNVEITALDFNILLIDL